MFWLHLSNYLLRVEKSLPVKGKQNKGSGNVVFPHAVERPTRTPQRGRESLCRGIRAATPSGLLDHAGRLHERAKLSINNYNKASQVGEEGRRCGRRPGYLRWAGGNRNSGHRTLDPQALGGWEQVNGVKEYMAGQCLRLDREVRAWRRAKGSKPRPHEETVALNAVQLGATCSTPNVKAVCRGKCQGQEPKF